MKRGIIAGGLIGLAAGFLAQAFGLVPLDAVTRALSVGSANFITIAFLVMIGFVIFCGVVGAVIGAALYKR